jgi:hypothetical protein
MKAIAWLSLVAIGLFLGTTGGAVHRVPQGIGGIRKLDAKRARRLVAEFTGDELALDSLTTLSVDAAEALAEFKGRSLSLDGLKTLSPEAARALAAFEGKTLHLNGLAAISPATALALAAFKGTGMWACRVLRG